MEAALLSLDRKEKVAFNDDEFSPDQFEKALSSLVDALRNAAPLLQQHQQQQQQAHVSSQSPSPSQQQSPNITANWLLAICSKVPSQLGTEFLAQSVLEASQLNSETEQQAALFEILGESEVAMEVLFEIASHIREIKQNIRKTDLIIRDNSNNERGGAATVDVVVDEEEYNRQMLRQEALDAAQIAAITKAEAEALNPSQTAGATHTVTRASGVQATKNAQKAAKRAAQALKKARDAGAIVEESELMAIDNNHLGDGGLMGMSQEQVWAMQQSLLPEGSKQYYDEKGLPKGTKRENEGNLERVIIPAAKRDESNLPQRLKIKDIMDNTAARAFTGTQSLNPMQSTVFEVAYHTRQNMLVCEYYQSSIVFIHVQMETIA